MTENFMKGFNLLASDTTRDNQLEETSLGTRAGF